MVYMPRQNDPKNDDDKALTLPSNLVTSSYSLGIVYDTTGSFMDFSGYKAPSRRGKTLEGVDPSKLYHERFNR